MPIPFLIGGLASIMGKNKNNSVKEAVKRHNGNLEKLRIKEADCTQAMQLLRDEKTNSLKALGSVAQRTSEYQNKPDFGYISFSNVRLLPYDEEQLTKAASDTDWFLSSLRDDAGSYLIENAASITISEDADKAWNEMAEAEKKIYKSFEYYDKVQILAEQLTVSMAAVRDLLEKHIGVLDAFKQKNGRTDWNSFNDTERFAVQNTVQLASMLYEMCTVSVIKEKEGEDDLEWINRSEVRAVMDKAEALCDNKGFEYNDDTYDVILRGDAKSYFSYRYRLEDRLVQMLPIAPGEAAPILEKLRMNANVSIAQDVTHLHARAVLDRLRDIDIKSQRVPSPDEKSIFYIELVRKEV